jgi:hypothetical protein
MKTLTMYSSNDASEAFYQSGTCHNLVVDPPLVGLKLFTGILLSLVLSHLPFLKLVGA